MTKYIALFCAAVMAISAGSAIVFADEADFAAASEEVIVEDVQGEGAAEENESSEEVPEEPEEEENVTGADTAAGEENGVETDVPSVTEVPEETEAVTEAPEAVEDVTETPASTEAPAVSESAESTETPAATETADASVTSSPEATEAAEISSTAVPEPTATAKSEIKEKTTEKPEVIKIKKTGINPFEDSQNAWYTDYITYAYENGLMLGMDDTHFEPYGNITRSQLAVILYRIHSNKLDIITEGDEWADEAEKWAIDNGIMADFIAGDFDGSVALTREEVVSSIFRAYQINNVTDGRLKSESLADWDKVSDYAVEAMQWAVYVGIIKGVGDTWIAPDRTVRRSEMATMLQRYLTNLTFEKADEDTSVPISEDTPADSVNKAETDAEVDKEITDEAAVGDENKAPAEDTTEELAEPAADGEELSAEETPAEEAPLEEAPAENEAAE